MTNAGAMDKDKETKVRRPDVLKKFTKENLNILERGLLGELPEKLQPRKIVRAERVKSRRSDLVAVEKQSGFISSCLGPLHDSSDVEISPEEDNISPLKKSFSFRETFSRINFFGKDKEKSEKSKSKGTEGRRTSVDSGTSDSSTMERENKSKKRFWNFRSKELSENKARHRPIFSRSKSYEFLPKSALEQENKSTDFRELITKNSQSFIVSNTDSLGADFNAISYDERAFLRSVKEHPNLESSGGNSSVSTETSNSGGIVLNLLKTESMENVLKEFDRTVDLFTENYMSDCEPYTKRVNDLSIAEKRRSSSFGVLPSPKILHVNKVSEVSEDFKKELASRLSLRQQIPRMERRISVTDWYVLEDQSVAPDNRPFVSIGTEAKSRRRLVKKPVNRVRRISSTKYWITPEECAVYSREARPPLVIPRITQYRTTQPRRDHRNQGSHPYSEESIQESASVQSSVRQYERLHDWSPSSERSRAELEHSFSKASSDSPPFVRINKRLGNSTENLLYPSPRRPNHLQLPASSSGDSLDVEIRDRDPGYSRNRKSKSMMAPKHRVRSPVPAPRMMLHQPAEMQVVHEGPVKRTKFSENGKKSKKNWSDCYVVLTQTALIFYKDQKTYYAFKTPKPPGTPPSPTAPRAELVLPLRHASVDLCMQMHTRRFTRSLYITVGRDQYLLQDENEEGAKNWVYKIRTIIHKLGPPGPDDISINQLRSSNTDIESLGRTPPLSRHNNRGKKQAGGSSNEDLSDSTEVSIQKSHVRSRLKKFFAKRPAMEVLVKKGIYKDEPVFGRKLEDVCPEKGLRVPNFVVACVKEIESSEENMCTDGLYRASGNLSQVQKIRLEIDQNNTSVIENNPDIHVLTGSLKLFFRELKEPLIPCHLFDRVLAACSIKPREAKIKEFREIIQALPQCNRDTLKFLLEHLLRVTQYSERNRMHTANLAIVFGPTLLMAPAEQAHNIAIDCIQQNNVVEVLLNDFKEIFTEDTKGKKKA